MNNRRYDIAARFRTQSLALDWLVVNVLAILVSTVLVCAEARADTAASHPVLAHYADMIMSVMPEDARLAYADGMPIEQVIATFESGAPAVLDAMWESYSFGFGTSTNAPPALTAHQKKVVVEAMAVIAMLIDVGRIDESFDENTQSKPDTSP